MNKRVLKESETWLDLPRADFPFVIACTLDLERQCVRASVRPFSGEPEYQLVFAVGAEAKFPFRPPEFHFPSAPFPIIATDIALLDALLASDFYSSKWSPSNTVHLDAD
jgi:hypothetical protein